MAGELYEASTGPVAAGLSRGDEGLRNFELAGMSTALQLEGFLSGAARPTRNDYDVMAHALNARFVELGGNHLVARFDDQDGTPEKDNP